MRNNLATQKRETIHLSTSITSPYSRITVFGGLRIVDTRKIKGHRTLFRTPKTRLVHKEGLSSTLYIMRGSKARIAVV